MLIVVAILLLVGLAFYLSRTKEPSYQGKTLMEWRVEFQRTGIGVEDAARMDTAAVPSYYAIRHIGTNAFPFLLREVAIRESPLKHRLISFINSRQKYIRIRPALVRRLDASAIFTMLGDLAQPVVPDLIQLTKDRDAGVRGVAFATLADLNLPPERMLAMTLHLLNDPDELVRLFAADILYLDYKEEAKKAELFKLFPGRYDDLTNNV
ncbi:MAG: domain containing protein, partial [Pedosphaera sp.]|nr:domain containing protein [Pedosphaera sp.]